MTNANSPTNSPKDVDIMKSRTISDAQLLEEGAQYVLDEGSSEARLELTQDQIASIEVDMRIDLAKTMNWSEAIEKQRDVIFATLRSDPELSRILSSFNCYRWSRHEEPLTNEVIIEKRYKSLEEALRKMDETDIEIFLRALKVEKVYITSHFVKNRHGELCSKIRLWLTPPVCRDYPDWGTNTGGGLAETDPLASRWFGEELVGKVTEGENSPFELIEKVKIKDSQRGTNGFGGQAGYDRWLLRRKPIKS